MKSKRKPRIFISRTSTGFADLGDRVAAHLRTRGFEIIIQTDFGLEWRKIRHLLIEKIRAADAVFCLVGPYCGRVPSTSVPEFRDPETGRENYSYTQLEYLIARKLRKPTITVLFSDDFGVSGNGGVPETEDLRDLQASFVREVICKDEHVRHRFASEEAFMAALQGKTIPISENILPEATPENIPFASIGSLFMGRQEVLERIRTKYAVASVAEQEPGLPFVQVIHGTGGLGKTRTIVEYVHSHAEGYEARLFVRGSSPRDIDDSMAALAGPFILNLEEQDEEDTDMRVAAVIRWLACHIGYLMVIDNVDNDEARNHVISLLDRLPRGHVLITSRLHTWPGNMARESLEVLNDEVGKNLLLNYRQSPKAANPDSDEEDARALVRQLGGLPLAIEQAAAYLNVVAVTISEYYDRWMENASRVTDWHDPTQMRCPVTVATTWLTSFEQLGDDSQKLLNILAWLAPDPIPRAFVSSSFESESKYALVKARDPYKALGELIHFALVNSGRDGKTIAVHRLIQSVSRDRQEPPTPAVALQSALKGAYKSYRIDTADVRTWDYATLFNPHALTVAKFGTERQIEEPSGFILNQAGRFFAAKGQFATAEGIFRQCLELKETTVGSCSPDVASILTNLFDLMWRTNRREEAEEVIRRALRIDAQCLGMQHPNYARDLNNLSLILTKTDRSGEAESLIRQAIAINRREGSDRADLARDLGTLGQILHDASRYEEAEVVMREGLAINESVFGEGHPTVAREMNNLAQLFLETAQKKEAESLLSRALAISQSCFGPSHPAVAVNLSNIAALIMDQPGRRREAEVMIRRAIAIDEEYFSPEHPILAVRLSILAHLLIGNGNMAEAEKCISRTLRCIENDSFGDDRSMGAALSILGNILQDTNRLQEAESVWRRALAFEQKAAGPMHWKTVVAMSNLASTLLDVGKFAEGQELMRKVLSTDEKISGPNNPSFAKSLNNYAEYLRQLKQFSEAEPMYRRAIAIDEAHLGQDHPEVAMKLNNLALLLHATGRATEADACYRRALSIDETRLGPNHPNVALRLANWSRVMETLGRVNEAESMMRRATTVIIRFARKARVEHTFQSSILQNYIGLLSDMGRSQSEITGILKEILNGVMKEELE